MFGFLFLQKVLLLGNRRKNSGGRVQQDSPELRKVQSIFSLSMERRH